MFEYPRAGERTILVDFSEGLPHAEADLVEFKQLACSAGAEVCATMSGRARRPHSQSYLGSGQVARLSEWVVEHGAELIIFNHALTPSQERNLEKIVKCRVLDRNGLILDIFASRAQSFEGKLQVELAQLTHLSTRLVRGWTHLERQKGGIGLRGPGETQLEMDKRLLADRVKVIKARLKKVGSQRAQNRRAREKKSLPIIALVGYTNAGKSTLFNALTAEKTYVADQLFATLDPCSRRLDLPHLSNAVLVDTVGFVRALPHELVNAFSATLEETVQADLLLHVVDLSDPEQMRHMIQVEQVLKKIGADQVPTLIVYNKIDKLESVSPQIRCDAVTHLPTHIWISAQAAVGLEPLREAIVACCAGILQSYTITLTAMQHKFRAQLYAMKVVRSETTDEQGQCHLTVRLSASAYADFMASNGLL